MKIFHRGFKKQYKKARVYGRGHIYRRPYVAPIMGLLVGVAIVGGVVLSRGGTASLRPSDSHVVFLSDSGQQETLDTKAKTVGDLVAKLPLHLISQDVVEPSLDTPIVQDNFRVNVYRARPVTVVDNSAKQVTLTAQRSARVVAQQAGLTVYPEDNVSFGPGSVTQNIIGEEVIVNPATPVQLTLYGTPLDIRTQAKTVGDMLKSKNVKINAKDTVTPSLSTPIAAGLQVNVIRNGIQVVSVQSDVPAPVQYINDTSLSLGATAVRQSGSPGVMVTTYQIDVEGGVEVSRTQLQQVVTTQPVPQIIARGTIVDIAGNKTAVMAAAGISSSDYGYADYIISHESGWCYTKAQGESYCPSSPDNSGTPNGYGLCQATPGYKMGSAGGDWATNPITQLVWCSGYANSRYGGWYNAYAHWLNSHNW